MIHLTIPSNNSGVTKQSALKPCLRRIVNSRFSHSNPDYPSLGSYLYNKSNQSPVSKLPANLGSVPDLPHHPSIAGFFFFLCVEGFAFPDT